MDRSTVVLGAVTLGLYLLCGALSVVRPAPYLPPAWIYLLTGLPLAAFVGFRLLRGRTFNLWEYSNFAVLALTALIVVLHGFGTRGIPLLQAPVEYLLVTGAPILGYLVVSLAIRPRRIEPGPRENGS